MWFKGDSSSSPEGAHLHPLRFASSIQCLELLCGLEYYFLASLATNGCPDTRSFRAVCAVFPPESFYRASNEELGHRFGGGSTLGVILQARWAGGRFPRKIQGAVATAELAF